MNTAIQVLQALRDGQFHSGTGLGRELGISRAAVWKAVHKLQSEWALQIDAVSGRGYRLAESIGLLDAGRIRQASGLGPQLAALEILLATDSTNRRLLQAAAAGASSGTVILAEHQSAGRGRRGRRWESPFGRNLYLSLLWEFEAAASRLAGLSLAVAIAVVRALEAAGLSGLGLKWPNDVWWQERKLAGILLEMRGEVSGPWQVAIGIGLNVNMCGIGMDPAWVDVQTIQGAPADRDLLAGRLLAELFAVLARFQHDGLTPLLPEWRARDVSRNRPVALQFPDRTLHGVARGINGDGALLLESDGIVKPWHAGEVSLRHERGI